MSEPGDYSAEKGPADEKDDSYLAMPYDLQPAELTWKDVGVTIVKRESTEPSVSPGFHTFPGEESSGGEGAGGSPDFGALPTFPDQPERTAFQPEAPETRPRCTGSDCFVSVPCHGLFSTNIHIAPQPLFSPTYLGDSPLRVMFSGPRRPPLGHRTVLEEVDIRPGATMADLVPPPGTDTIYIGCTGSGGVTLRFSIGVA
jgi:hypothetical protein